MYRKFKGSNAEYRALDYWVVKQLGKPQECENCGDTDKDTCYQWANISDNYIQDISDWARLCRTCHQLFDNLFTLNRDYGYSKGHCIRGHELTDDTAYASPTSGKLCRICKKDVLQKWRFENRVKAAQARLGNKWEDFADYVADTDTWDSRDVTRYIRIDEIKTALQRLKGSER